MEINFGKILIGLTFFLLCINVYPLIQSIKGKKMFLKTYRYLYYLTFIFISIAFVMLLAAFINNDFSNAYVYDNSSRDLSLIYLIAASWAGQSGSFLLWLLLLSFFGILIIISEDENEDILMTVMTISQIFILFILIVQSPFEQVWEKYSNNFSPGSIPQDGLGLNQLLIDPWMITHPPILFIGYASALIPFAYTIVGFIKKDYSSWLNLSLRWNVFSMTFLGIGIFLGAYWAYTVLGWGGYWGWDPVENSSLIPWIISVALIHSMILTKRKKSFIKTTLALSLSYYILVFFGTFLTRSGVLSDFSVHSFGDLGIGSYLVFIILIYLFVSIGFFIYRYKDIESEPLSEKFWTWDNFMAYGVIASTLYGIFILIGTSMPIITGALSKIGLASKASAVNINFYNNISIPIVIVILTVMITSTMLIMGEDLKQKKNIAIIIGSIFLGTLFNISFIKSFSITSIFSYVISIIAIFVIIRKTADFSQSNTKRILSSRITHIGLALLVLGAISSNVHSTKEQKLLVKDKEEKFSNFSLTLKEFVPGEKSSLKFEMNKDGSTSQFLTPYFIEKKMRSLYREPHILNNFFYDIYIIPENYKSGTESVNSVIINKGEDKKIGDLSIKFLEFDISGMRSEKPKVGALILANNKKISIFKTFSQGSQEKPEEVKIPGSDRKIFLMNINANTKSIMLGISPGKMTEMPLDTVVVNVSYKRFIWLVWLGTLFISIGGMISFIQNRKN